MAIINLINRATLLHQAYVQLLRAVEREYNTDTEKNLDELLAQSLVLIDLLILEVLQNNVEQSPLDQAKLVLDLVPDLSDKKP